MRAEPDAGDPVDAGGVDALLTGLAIQALTSEAELHGERIRDEVVRMVTRAAPRADRRCSRELARRGGRRTRERPAPRAA